MSRPTIVFSEADHTYTVNGRRYPSVTEVISSAGMGPQFFGASKDVLELAASRGTAVHAACAILDAGHELDPESIHASLVGYINGYRAFLRDTGFRARRTEFTVASTNYKYAGTVDKEGDMRRKRYIVDLKTGDAIHHSAFVQVAGYALAYEETEGEKVEGKAVLLLRDDGTYRLRTDDDGAFLMAENTFLCALGVHQWKEAHRG